MSGSLLVWMAVAIVFFWVVGVYQRVQRLRSEALAALATVEKQLRQYASVVQTHLGSSLESDVSAQWLALWAALGGLDAALKDAQREPLSVASLSRLSAAYASVQQAWATLCEAPVDLAGAVVPEAMRQQWDAVSAAVLSVRSGCNQTLAHYNEAITQFPARLVVGVMRFKAAGQL
jgi:LemA protein